MHKRGFLILTVIGALISSIATPAFAQGLDPELPQVTVQNLAIDQDDLTAGQTVTGTFVMSSGHPKDVANVMYKLSLVGAFDKDSGLPTEEYDTKTYGPVYIKSQEQNKLITFSYTLPKSFNTGSVLALRARAYLDSGIPLGWADKEIQIKGGIDMLTFSGASVSVDNMFFPVDNGPTVYATSTSSFVRVSLTNNTSQSITITPQVNVYTRMVSTKPLTTVTKDSLTIAPKQKVQVVVDLPKFNNKSGVYMGVVSFPDAQKINRATNVDFQYIIAGDQVVIDTLSSDKSAVKKAETFTVKIAYAGAPYDIVTARSVGAGDAKLIVKVFDEHNNPVAENSANHNFSEGSQRNVELTASRDARAMRAEVSVVKGSTVLATYAAPLSGDYDEMSKLSPVGGTDASTRSAVVAAVLSLVGLGVILAVILFMRTRAKRSLYVLAALIATSAVLLVGAQRADAASFTITKSESINCVQDKYSGYTGPQPHCVPGDFRPQVTNINSPSNQLDPGEAFQFAGTVKLRSCINTPAHAKITATFQGVTKTAWLFEYNGVTEWSMDHDFPLTSRDFATHISSKFVAPTKAGVYRLTFRIDNYTRVGNQHQPDNENGQTGIRGYTEGFMDITVGNPVVEPTVNLTASPNPVAYNTASTLKWSSTNTTACTASNGWSGTKTKSGTQSTGNLTAKKTYTITCTGPGGTAEDTVTVNVNGQPNPVPTVTFSANPTDIISGQNTNLSWSSTNASSCEAAITSTSPDTSATNAWNAGTNPSAASGLHSKVIPSLTKNTTFKITCYNSNGDSASKSATVNVQPKSVTPVVKTPNVTLIANKNTVTSGETVNLTYSPVNTASCTASASPANSGWTSGTENAANGSYTKTSSPITSNTTFTITCIGNSETNGQTVTDDVTVIVSTGPGTNPPTVVLTADPDVVNPGGSTVLTWTVSNATSCTAASTGNIWTGGKTATNGTHTATVNGIYNATEFRITCTGQGGSESDAAVVTMANSTLSCTPSPTSGVRIGDEVTWSATPGNLSPVSYTWSGTPELEDGSTGQSITATYTTKGLKYATVTATLGDGSKVTKQCSIPVSVGAKPTFIEF